MKMIDTPKRHLLVSGLMATLLVLSGCGGSGSSSGGASSSSSSVGYNETSYCPNPEPGNAEWPQLTFTSNAPKTLTLQWTPVTDASYYQVLSNTGGGFEPLGDPVTDTHFELPVNVHQKDWLNTLFLVEAYNDLNQSLGNSDSSLAEDGMLAAIGYIKPDDTNEHYRFGWYTALSADGRTLAVGAPGRYFTETVIIEDEEDEDAEPEEVEVTRFNAGAVYVFAMTDNGWNQQARLESFNPRAQQRFGYALSLSGDGDTLVVGAWRETSNATGVKSPDTDLTEATAANLGAAGAAYVFTRNAGEWTAEAYIKPHNTHANQRFGHRLALSEDGNLLAVGSPGERNNVTGVNPEADPALTLDNSGAVYLFRRGTEGWDQEAYIKASNAGLSDQFGNSLALTSDGSLLAVGASGEASNATGINGNQDNNSMPSAGAVYVFALSEDEWQQQAYIKPSNPMIAGFFGTAVALSANGDTLAVGASGERSNGTGVNSDTQADRSQVNAGAAYLFARNGDSWQQQAYIKSLNTAAGQLFGSALALSADGNTLALASVEERGTACGIDGDSTDLSAQSAGAVYLYSREQQTWAPWRYVKSPTTRDGQRFGQGLSLSADANTLAVGTHRDASQATGINSDRFDHSLRPSAGAVFLY